MDKNILFETLVGSRLWHMHTLGSDYDYFKVYIAPLYDVLIGKEYKKSFDRKEKSLGSAIGNDVEYHEIGKVVDMLIKGNINFMVGVFSQRGLNLEEYETNPYQYEIQAICSTPCKNLYHSCHGLAKGNYERYILSGKEDTPKKRGQIYRVGKLFSTR